MLDASEPDTDLEPSGDELDGTSPEDEPLLGATLNSCAYAAPGFPISDPNCAVDDGPCDENFDHEDDHVAAVEFSDPEVRTEQCGRIRQTRCSRRLR